MQILWVEDGLMAIDECDAIYFLAISEDKIGKIFNYLTL
jgi:hypothetical protein